MKNGEREIQKLEDVSVKINEQEFKALGSRTSE